MQLLLAWAPIAWLLAPLPLPPFLGFTIIIHASNLLHIFSTLFFYIVDPCGSCFAILFTVNPSPHMSSKFIG